MKPYYLHLNAVFHDSPSRITGCLETWPSYDDFLAYCPELIAKSRAKDTIKERMLARFRGFDATQYLAALSEKNIDIMTRDDADYPAKLRHLHHPPVLLYIKGDRRLLQRPSFAVVGSREHSVYGATATRTLTQQLCRHFVILSGMAKGIDGIAHRQALACRQPSIAILGTGLDVIYPTQHATLYDQLCAHGLVISEQPLGVSPEPYRFPQRNRLISALTEGLLLTEASEKSGAVISANFASDLGRPVYCAPGHLQSETSIGAHRLIQDGAKLVHSVDDILVDFDAQATLPKTQLPRDISTAEEKVLIALRSEAMSADNLAIKTDMSLTNVLHYISLLELKGHIQRQPGNRYAKV